MQRPKLKVSFDKDRDYKDVCVECNPVKRYDGSDLGSVNIIRLKVTNQGKEAAKSCRAFLTNIQVADDGKWKNTDYWDSIGLHWAYEWAPDKGEGRGDGLKNDIGINLLPSSHDYIDVLVACEQYLEHPNYFDDEHKAKIKNALQGSVQTTVDSELSRIFNGDMRTKLEARRSLKLKLIYHPHHTQRIIKYHGKYLLTIRVSADRADAKVVYLFINFLRGTNDIEIAATDNTKITQNTNVDVYKFNGSKFSLPGDSEFGRKSFINNYWNNNNLDNIKESLWYKL